ncbi:MAG: Rrf2 family transcriptional regulator [Synergistaceae bacterium]|nr:Rrf2 family transcriptional regulator [Synergistaceae bacterium]MBQ3399621.1 Rrf2 family transcriptional regulator [Synergistaceae bacterium]MBQ6002197.1 Rrf2 family transcriptional regulator [Synergistaceae bacterium]MBQ6418626.1 Rrf2 family transcriptional regulator [Synergistaceae bacterium]MBQ6666410.1 Rrf2 family transcriptional regulator [Synergistaceae bacterium]
MQISSRFTIAVHIITCIDYFHEGRSMTSDFIASSVGVNPVMIRQIILQLKAAGIVEVSRGKGGIVLSRPLEDVTLYDIYEAVESVKGRLFRFHENPNPDCPVGKKIHSALDETLDEIQAVLEEKMRSITARDISSKISD